MEKLLAIKLGATPKQIAVAPKTYRGLSLAIALKRMRRDLLSTLTEIVGDHDVVALECARQLVYVVNDPALVRHVLKHNDAFIKPDLGARFRLWFDPDGLVTAATFRSMAARAFDRARIDAVVGDIDRIVASVYPRLDFHAIRQEPLDLSRLAMRLSLLVSSRVLFGARLGSDVETIIGCLDAVQDYYASRPVALALGLSDWIPSGKVAGARAAIGFLRRAVQQIIDLRRLESSSDSQDLLSDLLVAADLGALSQGLVRNIVMAALLSSYETTGCALTWSLICLSTHTFHLDAIAAEGHSLPDRLTCLNNLSGLELTRRVFKEALRLYPPSWIIVRETKRQQRLGPYSLRGDAQVFVSPYLMHRHPEYWSNGSDFDPDRFAAWSEATRSDAYIPFGAGPHACFGAQFATLVAQVALARLASRYAFRRYGAALVRPRPMISLQAGGGFQVVPTRRVLP
jgi:cytochrome P450